MPYFSVRVRSCDRDGYSMGDDPCRLSSIQFSDSPAETPRRWLRIVWEMGASKQRQVACRFVSCLLGNRE